jgi:polyhydroxybutyrate depolymerase
MKRILLLTGTLVLAAAIAGCASLIGARPLATAAPGATTFHTINVAGRTRSFLLHLPPAAATHRVPLVLLFHGDGGSGNEIMQSSRMNDYADAHGFAVAYPNGTGPLRYTMLHWNAVTCCGYGVDHAVNDIFFADSLVTLLIRSIPIDSTRVYAAGFSAGGMLALRLACERASVFRAVVDVAGVMPDTSCAPARPVSVMFFQGRKDNSLRAEFTTLLRRGRPFATSLEAAMRFWARRDGCSSGTTHDSTSAYNLDRAASCPHPYDVQLYTINGHPHAWPGGGRNWFFEPDPARDVKASALILEFFSQGGG